MEIMEAILESLISEEHNHDWGQVLKVGEMSSPPVDPAYTILFSSRPSSFSVNAYRMSPKMSPGTLRAIRK